MSDTPSDQFSLAKLVESLSSAGPSTGVVSPEYTKSSSIVVEETIGSPNPLPSTATEQAISEIRARIQTIAASKTSGISNVEELIPASEDNPGTGQDKSDILAAATFNRRN